MNKITSILKHSFSHIVKFLCALLVATAYVTTVLHAQDYVVYQQALNRVDKHILSNDLDGATVIMDSLGHNYEFIFARHCFKALQIACVRNDSLRADYWLSRCLLRGIPLWILRHNELTGKSLYYQTTQQTLARRDSLNLAYEKSINRSLGHTIDSLMVEDQKYTRKVNDGFFLFRHTLYGLQWIHNNTRIFRHVKRLIEQYGYPGERLIGLGDAVQDSASLVKFVRNDGAALTLSQRTTLFILLHYTSSPRKDITPLLYSSIADGKLPANQYGRISDYLVRYSKKKFGAPRPYWVFYAMPSGNIDSVNYYRNAIGLNVFEEQQRNDSLRLEWRKTGTINTRILLE